MIALVHHHVYDNFWKSNDKKDIHKYVLNNANEVKSRLFKHANLLMALSGHKHLNSVTRENGVAKIATCGFVVPQDPNNLNDHRMRHIEIANGVITQRVVSIV